VRSVAKEMEKIFAEHGYPHIIKTEFKGAAHRMFQKKDIKVVKSRPLPSSKSRQVRKEP
jgi:hypothetical protein